MLKNLEENDFKELVARANEHLPSYSLTPDAFSLLVTIADGDARKFLGTLEHLVHACAASGQKELTPEFVKETAGSVIRRFDKNGDQFYDLISAFQKTVRGSDPDAALYWLARLVDGGVDLRYVARRLIVMASEEVGNADPRALDVAVNAAQAFERLGSPEGELALAHATVYIAVAPKSNAVYLAWKQAKGFVANDGTRPVPMKLRNAPTELLKSLGANQAYRYAHNEPNAFAAGETYFPEGMPSPEWYQPNLRGLEIKISEKLTRLKQANAEATEQKTPKSTSA